MIQTILPFSALVFPSLRLSLRFPAKNPGAGALHRGHPGKIAVSLPGKCNQKMYKCRHVM